MVWGICLAAAIGPVSILLGASARGGEVLIVLGVLASLAGVILVVVAAHRALTTLHQVGLALGMKDASPAADSPAETQIQRTTETSSSYPTRRTTAPRRDAS